jgi:hypothetical protein
LTHPPHRSKLYNFGHFLQTNLFGRNPHFGECLIQDPSSLSESDHLFRVLAHKLAAQGWKIALLSCSQEKLDNLAKVLKDKHRNASIVIDTVDVGDASAFM